MPFIRYLLTYATHEISNFIRYLAIPIILFPLTSVEDENFSVNWKLLNALIRIRHDFHNFDKIKETAADKLKNTKQRII